MGWSEIIHKSDIKGLEKDPKQSELDYSNVIIHSSSSVGTGYYDHASDSVPLLSSTSAEALHSSMSPIETLNVI